jgi:hypothetical protein
MDDAQNGLNDAHLETPWTLGKLTRKLEAMSQTWGKLLFCSGGAALELSKCFYYIIYWKWVSGLPQMLQNSEMKHVPGITLLIYGFSKLCLPIQHREVLESHVTLGASRRMNPPCHNIDQVIYLCKEEANRISNLIITSNLSSWQPFISN